MRTLSKKSLQHVVCTNVLAVTALLALPLSAYADCDPNAVDPRYTVNGGEVYDTKTNLTWQRCSVGQTWSQGACSGTVQGLSWEQAKKKAVGGWRLPTKSELLSLAERSCGAPKADKTIFPNMADLYPMYWSSDADETKLAWLVGMDNGGTFNGIRTSANAVRLVKAGK